MDAKTKTIIMEKAQDYLNADRHCSEGILLAVGEHYLGEINPEVLRLSTAFAVISLQLVPVIARSTAPSLFTL